MAIRGWVYVMSNRSFAKDLVKIGFTTKDPMLRASELDGTGLPYKFELEYDVLVYEPRRIEQGVHKELKKFHESKEFFRVYPAEAILAIRTVITRLKMQLIRETMHKDTGIKNSYQSQTNIRIGYGSQHCPVCNLHVTDTDSRCPNCFSLL